MRSKIFHVLLVVVLATLIFGIVTPAFAQIGVPPAAAAEGFTIDWQAVWDFCVLAGTFLAIVTLLAYGQGISAEAIKDLLRWFTANPLLKFAFPDGIKSMLVAFLVAFAAAQNFDTSVWKDIPMVAALPETTITVMTAVITWAISSFMKREGYLDAVYKAKPTADYHLETIKGISLRRTPVPPAGT